MFSTERIEESFLLVIVPEEGEVVDYFVEKVCLAYGRAEESGVADVRLSVELRSGSA